MIAKTVGPRCSCLFDTLQILQLDCSSFDGWPILVTDKELDLPNSVVEFIYQVNMFNRL